MDYVECPACAMAYTWYRLNGKTSRKPMLGTEYTIKCVCGIAFDVTPSEESYEETEKEEAEETIRYQVRDWRWLWGRKVERSYTVPVLKDVIVHKRRVITDLRIRDE